MKLRTEIICKEDFYTESQLRKQKLIQLNNERMSI